MFKGMTLSFSEPICECNSDNVTFQLETENHNYSVTVECPECGSKVFHFIKEAILDWGFDYDDDDPEPEPDEDIPEPEKRHLKVVGYPQEADVIQIRKSGGNLE